MSFFGRVMNYVFNEVLVNTLANRLVLHNQSRRCRTQVASVVASAYLASFAGKSI